MADAETSFKLENSRQTVVGVLSLSFFFFSRLIAKGRRFHFLAEKTERRAKSEICHGNERKPVADTDSCATHKVHQSGNNSRETFTQNEVCF